MRKKVLKNLKLIVCVGEDNLIGEKNPSGNGLLWHIKEELQYFKSLTVGNTLLFGASTAKYVPIELMRKNREVIVLHRNMNVPELVDNLLNEGKTIFVCGGASIYKYFLDNFIFEEIYLSKISKKVEVKGTNNPLYFPNLESYGYEIKEQKEFDEFTAYTYKVKEEE